MKSLTNKIFKPQSTQRLRRFLKVNAGIACLDKANEVEFRPNEETCHPYGILLTDDIFSTDISSLRDLSATTELTERAISSTFSKSRRGQSVPFTVIASAAWQSVTINAFLVRDWLRRALLRTMRSIVRDYHVAALLVMTGKGRDYLRAISSTFSKSRRDDTLLTVCFSLRSFSLRSQQQTFALSRLIHKFIIHNS
ncbi:MAG: hypothetical protein LBG80_01810 [Bacteroidales bacterium]|nr:hypothetical protein [Bacteroidales bacterium]